MIFVYHINIYHKLLLFYKFRWRRWKDQSNFTQNTLWDKNFGWFVVTESITVN